MWTALQLFENVNNMSDDVIWAGHLRWELNHLMEFSVKASQKSLNLV